MGRKRHSDGNFQRVLSGWKDGWRQCREAAGAGQPRRARTSFERILARYQKEVLRTLLKRSRRALNAQSAFCRVSIAPRYLLTESHLTTMQIRIDMRMKQKQPNQPLSAGGISLFVLVQPLL